MADFPTEPETNKCMDALWYCGPFVGITSLLGLIVVGFAYLVFSIMALADISNTAIQDNCDSSNIWIFLLLTLILGLTNHSHNFKNVVDNKGKWCKIVCSSILQLAFTSWGAYEVWGVDCVDTSISIYKMTKIYVITSFSISGLLLYGSLLYGSSTFMLEE